MRLRTIGFMLVWLLIVSGMTAHAQQGDEIVELRMGWYTDGNEDVVMRDLLDQFELENPDIRVIMEDMSFDYVSEELPGLLANGEGPDMARFTNLGGLSAYYLDLRPYLTDAPYWEDRFGATLQWLRPEGDRRGIYGYMTQLTITGPFINRTLFGEAGVPVPSDISQRVSWEEWAEASKAVADKLDIPIAIAMDRSGHRFSGPAISMGAKFFNRNGYPQIDDPGFRAMADLFVGWHKNGTMPFDIWGANTGYADAAEEFANGQIVFYMSGSWQIRYFSDNIAGRFHWQAVPNPCGPAACTGMPGGAALVALKSTKHPEAVARVMEYLVSTETLSEFSARTLFIPTHLGLVVTGLQYDTDDVMAQDALGVFLGQVTSLNKLAYDLQGYRYNHVIFNSIRNRLTQVINDKLPLDDAIPLIQSDIDVQLAELK